MSRLSASDYWDHYPKADKYRDRVWVEQQSYRFFVRLRRKLCLPNQILDIWLVGPLCEVCLTADPFESMRVPALPDITVADWEQNFAWQLGDVGMSIVRRAKVGLRKNAKFAFGCSKCGLALRPWTGDNVWIYTEQFEEKYAIPAETPGKREASREMRRLVMQLYGNRCFGCGAREVELHIDHVRPRSRGGDRAFRNLQPLCEACGQKKGDSVPEEVTVNYDLWFREPPSDAYEELFW